MYFRLTLFIAFVLVAGCSQKLAMPDDQAMSASAEKALMRAIEYRAIKNRCMQAGQHLKERWSKAHQDWWQRNHNVLAAADAVYKRDINAYTLPVGDPRLLPVLAFVSQADKSGRQYVSKRPITEIEKRQRCTAILDEVNTQRFDILVGKDKKQNDYLRLAFFNQDLLLEDISLVPSVIANIEWRYQAGKSYYAAEKQAYRQCSSIEMLLLNSQQSDNEVYAVFCGDGVRFYVQCHKDQCNVWGQQEVAF